MNAMDRVLQDEVSRLLDRLAASVPGGCLAAVAAGHPGLRARLDEAEGRLAAARASLLEDYGRWRRALEDLENLWAVAAWRTGDEGSVPAPASGQSPSLAA